MDRTGTEIKGIKSTKTNCKDNVDCSSLLAWHFFTKMGTKNSWNKHDCCYLLFLVVVESGFYVYVKTHWKNWCFFRDSEITCYNSKTAAIPVIKKTHTSVFSFQIIRKTTNKENAIISRLFGDS